MRCRPTVWSIGAGLPQERSRGGGEPDDKLVHPEFMCPPDAGEDVGPFGLQPPCASVRDPKEGASASGGARARRLGGTTAKDVLVGDGEGGQIEAAAAPYRLDRLHAASSGLGKPSCVVAQEVVKPITLSRMRLVQGLQRPPVVVSAVT